VASRAADFVEERFAVFGFGSLRERHITRGRLRGTHESREVIDIGKPIGIGFIVRFGGRVTDIGDFVGLKPISDAHLVEISISLKRQKTGVLIFPAEPADSGLTRNLNNRNIKRLSANFAMALLTLIFGKVEQGLVRERFDEAIPEQ